MKRKQRDGIKKAKPVRRKKKKQKGGSLLFLFTMVVFFSVSLFASYIYFRPMFEFDSSFIDEIGTGRSVPIQKEKKPGRLYKSNGDKPKTRYNAEHREDSAIVNAEGVIRKHLESYRTSLLDLYMKEGVVYIDISKDIRKSFRGDAYEEYEIIAGLCRSIKASIPDFTTLKIIIEGKEAESFGGHINISRPIRGDISEIAGKI